ncbi:MAG: hypothetical protein JW892_07555, partial [Anaerolineae bacterium]|nr:hypothetical protein [Anaerolineae bacterium]
MDDAAELTTTSTGSVLGIRQNIGENKIAILQTTFVSDQPSAPSFCRSDFRERGLRPRSRKSQKELPSA